MIFIVTDQFDEHANIVERKLIAKGIDLFRFNIDVASLQSTQITYIDEQWFICQAGRTITATDIEAVWYRRAFVELLLEEKENRDVDFLIWKNEWNKVLLGFYLSISEKQTLCPIKQSYATENKFWQYSIAKGIGFHTPELITSNNPERLATFTKAHNENVVLKLHTQDFYKVGESYQGLYVNKIDSHDLSTFKDTSENPITLQQYIDKAYEVRYTVVGKDHFCCRIESQKSKHAKVDWRRYDLPNTPHYSFTSPDHIHDMVDTLLDKCGINFGALDFIVDLNGDWYFLEINSMGQWLWIEDLTDLKISDAICDWLINNARKEVI